MSLIMFIKEKNMCEISTTEFKNNFGKYVELGEKEEIVVKKRERIIFRIMPEKLRLANQAKSFFGMLPEGATIGVDPNERG